ncbi:MAG: sulfotransferase domain-containing protein [Euryhalocaulis sp.]|uniref:sulfotransferase domain-containing protein n=1 Tax=Euryhalocaulis sp. TaxID=2744307 RepID=UPI001814656F|nr:sulfotransferase domain-containing protein [Euryhalocaulis sp.]MBA4802311.1 sulfotransferase domain-containing protein [Euryhalocaulis sp.]
MTILVTASASPASAGEYDDTIRVDPSARWAGPSAYLFSLHKAGSSLLNGMVEMLCEANGAAFIPVPNLLRRAGHNPNRDVVMDDSAFAATGVVFGGFRLLPDYALPGLEDAPKILLLRDPRDILTSLYFSVASSHVAPGEGALKQAFERNREYVKAAPINRIVKERAPNLKTQIERYLEKLPRRGLAVYHYEDVVLNKAAWIADLADVLGLDADEETARAILDRFDIVPDSEAPDSHVRRVLPGDHRDKLGPKTIDMLDALFTGIYDPLLSARREIPS